MVCMWFVCGNFDVLPWLSMKRGGCKFGGSKTGAVLCPKRGAVVSQLVLKLKE